MGSYVVQTAAAHTIHFNSITDEGKDTELLSGLAASTLTLNTRSRNLGVLKGENAQGIITSRNIDARICFEE